MSHLFNTKADFWEALHRDGIYIPTIESSICTVKWLDKVYHGEQWCPKYSQLTLRPCTRKPVKMCFLLEISKILKQRNLKPIIYDQQHTPDVFWCWITLSTLDPDHLFFQKHYVPSEEEKGRKSKCDSKQTVISKKEMDFLKDLPANILKNKMHELNFSDEHDFDFPSGVKSQRQPNIKHTVQRHDYIQNENLNSNNFLNNQTFQNMSKNHQQSSQTNTVNGSNQFNFSNQHQNRSLSNQRIQNLTDAQMVYAQEQSQEKDLQVVLTKKKNQN